MDWDDKIELVRLGNKRLESSVTRKRYQEFVLAHVDTFDGQAIDMFITNETLISEDVLESKEFYTEAINRINELIKDPDINNKVSMRADIRLGILEELIKEN